MQDFSREYNDNFDDSRPTILFDLNGVLIQPRTFHEEKQAQQQGKIRQGELLCYPRPGLRHLVSLCQYFRIGLYTSARMASVVPRAAEVWERMSTEETVKVQTLRTDVWAPITTVMTPLSFKLSFVAFMLVGARMLACCDSISTQHQHHCRHSIRSPFHAHAVSCRKQKNPRHHRTPRLSCLPCMPSQHTAHTTHIGKLHAACAHKTKHRRAWHGFVLAVRKHHCCSFPSNE